MVSTTTRAGIEAAHTVTEEWVVKMSIQKTKLLVARVKSENERDSMPIIIKDEAIKVVSDFNTWAQLLNVKVKLTRI